MAAQSNYLKWPLIEGARTASPEATISLGRLADEPRWHFYGTHLDSTQLLRNMFALVHVAWREAPAFLLLDRDRQEWREKPELLEWVFGENQEHARLLSSEEAEFWASQWGIDLLSGVSLVDLLP
jgi:hypothetical protein